MKLISTLLILLLLVSITGFASASYYLVPSYNTGKSTGLTMKIGNWTGIAFTSMAAKKKSNGFDRARCGTYYWDVQDRRHCWSEWKEKGVHIKGW